MQRHIPRWLATPGMGADKIAAFYADPVKRAYDAHSADKAFFLRSLSIDPGLAWTARRWARVAAGGARHALRTVRTRFRSPDERSANRASPTFAGGRGANARARP